MYVRAGSLRPENNGRNKRGFFEILEDKAMDSDYGLRKHLALSRERSTLDLAHDQVYSNRFDDIQCSGTSWVYLKYVCSVAQRLKLLLHIGSLITDAVVQ